MANPNSKPNDWQASTQMQMQAIGWRLMAVLKGATGKEWVKFYPPPHDITPTPDLSRLTVIGRQGDATWNIDLKRAAALVREAAKDASARGA
jgi:hypothetical protein